MSEKQKCSERVSGEGRYGSFHQHLCRNKPIVERDGKWYCKIHDPERVKERQAKATIKWNAEQYRMKVERVALKECYSVNGVNPLAVARNIGEMVKELETTKLALESMLDSKKFGVGYDIFFRRRIKAIHDVLSAIYGEQGRTIEKQR